MNKVKRWLAVSAGHDTVKLLPMEGCGPDFFVKLADYERLENLWRRYFLAEDKGIAMSSDKDGTWNIAQEARAALASFTSGVKP